MMRRTRRRSHRLAGLLAATALSALVLAACGSEQEAPSETTTGTGTPAAVSENPDAPVVGGPRITPSTPAGDTRTDDSDDGDTACGTTSGPDGPLRIIITDGTVTCDDAKSLAEKYGPMIVTGQPQTVDGWRCGPSDDSGVLAACERGDDEIDFAP